MLALIEANIPVIVPALTVSISMLNVALDLGCQERTALYVDADKTERHKSSLAHPKNVENEQAPLDRNLSKNFLIRLQNLFNNALKIVWNTSIIVLDMVENK